MSGISRVPSAAFDSQPRTHLFFEITISCLKCFPDHDLRVGSENSQHLRSSLLRNRGFYSLGHVGF
ncbi:hypothetical protein M758_4G132700 [Ceratodon purpureus]|nr:hypothetical protein M758_4G132700 [Ceratodon purpureus]